jgi:hypothetical protein
VASADWPLDGKFERGFIQFVTRVKSSVSWRSGGASHAVGDGTSQLDDKYLANSVQTHPLKESPYSEVKVTVMSLSAYSYTGADF